MTLTGVSGPTKFVGKDNFEVRSDGFGRMTDDEVSAYMAERVTRPEYLAMLVKDLDSRVRALETAEPEPEPEAPE